MHLSARLITVRFGALAALEGVDFELKQGDVIGLIGPNGAGKTTLVNVLSGYQRPSSGAVFLDGRDITKSPPDRRARAGIVRTFQSGRLFGSLTLCENVEAAAVSSGRSLREARRTAEDVLLRLELSAYATISAATLPHGVERLAALARALATQPRLLLLDEPAAGLDERESDDLLTHLRQIAQNFCLGLVVIEHDMRLVMRLCDRLHVLDHGRTIAVGTPEDVRSHAGVVQAYLGTTGGHDARG